MKHDPQTIADNIDSLVSITELMRLTDARLTAGEPEFLTDLGIALWHRYGSSTAPPWQYRSLSDHLVQRLATARGTRNIEQALRLVTAAGSTETMRRAAMLLAASQSSWALAALPATSVPPELRACLLQELILRDIRVDRIPGLARWTLSADQQQHPLGWLPLTLTNLEEHPPVPQHTLAGTWKSYGSAEPLPDQPPIWATRGHEQVPAWQETTTAPRAEAMSAAVANWRQDSHGRIEACTFSFDTALEENALVDSLLELGLECLTGTDVDLDLVVKPCGPTWAWQTLFAAASLGGAYNSGILGGYGRLAAWHTMAALCGLASSSTPVDVEQRSRECFWYTVEARNDWYVSNGWDLGLAVITTDRRTLAVLAATDGD